MVLRAQGTVLAYTDLHMPAFFLNNVNNMQYVLLTSTTFIIICWFCFYTIFFLPSPTPIHHCEERMAELWVFWLMRVEYSQKYFRAMVLGAIVQGRHMDGGPGSPHHFSKAWQHASNLSTHWVLMFTERILPKKKVWNLCITLIYLFKYHSNLKQC